MNAHTHKKLHGLYDQRHSLIVFYVILHTHSLCDILLNILCNALFFLIFRSTQPDQCTVLFSRSTLSNA